MCSQASERHRTCVAMMPRADAHAFKEKQTTESVISKIKGDNGDARCVVGSIPFWNLSYLIDAILVLENPDCYYRVRPEQLDRRIFSELKLYYSI